MAEQKPDGGGGQAGGDRLVALEEQIKEAEGLYEELKALKVFGRRFGLLVVLAILLILLFNGLSVVHAARKLDAEEFGDALAPRIEPVAAQAARQLSGSFDRLWPVYDEELRKQMGEHWPEMEDELWTQVELYRDNVLVEGEKRLDERVEKMVKNQEAYLCTQFKQIENAKTRDVVMSNLEGALQDAVLDVLQHRVAEAEERLCAIYGKIVLFLPEDRREDFCTRMEAAWGRLTEQLAAEHPAEGEE